MFRTGKGVQITSVQQIYNDGKVNSVAGLSFITLSTQPVSHLSSKETERI